jgi:Domain of unknown function (DUF4345)
MELKLYLIINALLYLVFGAWCALAPEWTSAAVGLGLLGAQGFTEFIAVYGGLEVGVGVFFLICAFQSKWARAGVLFGVCFYLGIVLFRTLAIASVGLDIGNALNFYIAEALFSLWSIRLFFKGGIP